jgi:hypothetical protein
VPECHWTARELTIRLRDAMRAHVLKLQQIRHFWPGQGGYALDIEE